ncbi:MAG TPA: histidine kinase dimerization/phospho-acceptor domain-containing protein, partial [Chroococcales cyanobacterium]
MGIKTEDIYTSLLQHTADGLVVSDGQGVITACNPAFVKLLGRPESDIVGQKLSSIIDLDGTDGKGSSRQAASGTGTNAGHPAGAAGGTTNGAKPGSGIIPPYPATITCRSGMDLTMPISQIPINSAGSAGKKGQGTITIVYIVQANSVQQAQTEFVSTVSHELRTPLTSIKGFADTILRAGDRLDQSQQRRYVGIIKDQADRLTRLVEDLLAVSRLESKRMQLTIRAIDLGEAIERVVRNLSDKAREHRITMTGPPGLPPVWADADRLEQILTNLIDNAIKYSPPKT